MHRQCAHCGRAFAPADLAREESRELEALRKGANLDGVRFLAYRCPCGTEDIFVDVLPRDDEFADDFDRRRADLESVARRLQGGGTQIQVLPVTPPDTDRPAA